jgi:hypothetical protein
MPTRNGGEAPAPAVSLSRHERGVRGGGGLERRAVHMSAGRTRGLRWGSCGEERIACASHVLTCHVVSSTSRPERLQRRASHHATRSGPAHMSMSEVLRARTTMFACAGVCRHFSEPAASHENGITIRFGNPPRTSVVADAVARPRTPLSPASASSIGYRRWRCPRAPLPQCPLPKLQSARQPSCTRTTTPHWHTSPQAPPHGCCVPRCAWTRPYVEQYGYQRRRRQDQEFRR